MKTLKDHVILYDAVCPMCNLYTSGFLQAGMLEKNGRIPYQNLPDNLACCINQQRSVNEIALVNTADGSVTYGVRSLLKIIGHSVPFLQPLLCSTMFVKITDKLYKFISFNRRVIMPAKKDQVFGARMDPSFHRGYRLTWLVFTWLAAAWFLFRFSQKLSAILPQASYLREVLICGGQLLWQGFAVWRVKREAVWDYLGNLMTVSYAGGLLLCLLTAIAGLLPGTGPLLYAAVFGLVVLLMLAEHIRRIRLLELPGMLTLSWIAYRLILLIILYVVYAY